VHGHNVFREGDALGSFAGDGFNTTVCARVARIAKDAPTTLTHITHYLIILVFVFLLLKKDSVTGVGSDAPCVETTVATTVIITNYNTMADTALAFLKR